MCSEELKAAQHWNGPSVIELLKQQPVYVNANPVNFGPRHICPELLQIYKYVKDRTPDIDTSRFSIIVLVVPG